MEVQIIISNMITLYGYITSYEYDDYILQFTVFFIVFFCHFRLSTWFILELFTDFKQRSLYPWLYSWRLRVILPNENFFPFFVLYIIFKNKLRIWLMIMITWRCIYLQISLVFLSLFVALMNDSCKFESQHFWYYKIVKIFFGYVIYIMYSDSNVLENIEKSI